MYDASGVELTSYKKTTAETLATQQQIYIFAGSKVGYYTPTNGDSIATASLKFEITDHQGSVRAIVTGRKLTNGNADIVTAMEYYTFGGIARKYQSADNPVFGFHGMKMEMEEGDDDYTTDYRQYDSDLGRWLSPDPLMDMFPDLSPYNFNYNNPVNFTDPEGLKPKYSRSDRIISGGGGESGGGFLSAVGGALGKIANVIATAYQALDKLSKAAVKVENDLRKYTDIASGVNDQLEKAKSLKGQGGPKPKPKPNKVPDSFEGVPVIDNDWFDLKEGAAFTTPKAIFLSKKFYNERSTLYPNEIRDLLRHEFGHYLQHRRYGIGMGIVVVPTSCRSASISCHEHKKNKHLKNCKRHKQTWTEKDANTLSYLYFGKPENWNEEDYPLDYDYMKGLEEKGDYERQASPILDPNEIKSIDDFYRNVNDWNNWKY